MNRLYPNPIGLVLLLTILTIAQTVASVGVIYLRDDPGRPPPGGYKKLSDIRGPKSALLNNNNKKQDPQNANNPGLTTLAGTTQQPYVFNTRTNIFNALNGSVPQALPQVANNPDSVAREELIARWALGLLIALFVVFVISSVLSIIWCILVRCFGIKPNWWRCCYCCERRNY